MTCRVKSLTNARPQQLIARTSVDFRLHHFNSIAVAQIRPVAGDLDANLQSHLRAIELASSFGANVVIFPELSMTGYEPRLASAFALPSATSLPPTVDTSSAHPSTNHRYLFTLEEACQANGLVAYVGMPIETASKPQIAAIPFGVGSRQDQPSPASMLAYGKHFLHADEVPFFDPGIEPRCLEESGMRFALAICYELSVDQHCQTLMDSCPSSYVASVAKHKSGMQVASARLAGIAEANQIPTLVANSLGTQDGMDCCGNSAVWGPDGKRLATLDSQPGVIALNLETLNVDLCEL